MFHRSLVAATVVEPHHSDDGGRKLLWDEQHSVRTMLLGSTSHTYHEMSQYNLQLQLKQFHYTPRQALGVRVGLATAQSWPRHQMGVSGQRHAPEALYPPGKGPPGTHCTRG
jgi:hypothetical protein